VAGRGLRVHGGRVVIPRVLGLTALYLAGVVLVLMVVFRALGVLQGEFAPIGGLR
jgi:hypothetical protein